MKHEMTIMNETGDTRIGWDVGNSNQVEIARNAFEGYKEKNYLAFSGNALVDNFDPEIKNIVLVPPIVGG